MTKDFYRGDMPLAAWGRIQRDMKILDFLYKSGRNQEAKELKVHIKKELVKFKEIYG